MKRQHVFFMVFWLLLAMLLPATSTPTAAMFKGQVTVTETGTRSLQERYTDICRQLVGEKDGTVIFTAWAFPAFERIHSCRRYRDGRENGPLTVGSQNGRIVVNAHGDHNLNITNDAQAKNDGDGWGVLLFLNRVADGRCQIIDMHLLAPDRQYDLGNERLTWLGTADEAQGLEFIRALSGRDVERKLRKELVFALYLFRGRAAVSELIRLARHDPDPDVRKQAIFWLGQKASQEAVKALGDVLASPEALEIKKQAVFALSQLPEDIGTPKLLAIARSHPQPQVRKSAIFWLGQSDDPRAVDLFTEILTK